ncbi:unnamed protein product [Rotaria magnacalcarata]|uniref:F-box domain-containing protein n=1 Tax=Rotaria magnacalcarata TaxID=392030 RepID=A0A816MN39_9BILA|nr:unnamed protein product [Rotaria magnacalcarata]
MEYTCVQLNDLPDEVLMIILKKLANMEVLYSLVGVHKRLNRIAQDSVFTNNLTLFISSSNGFVYSLPDPILDRFFSHILPKIHQKIKWLGLESLSIERILRATNYPNLYGISLYNIQAETAIGLFTDETSSICTLKNQILELVLDISTNKIQSLPEKIPTLKCFSLHCDIETCVYDELILPLLHRMLNLEKLSLCLIVGDRKTFFDGNDLKINIINNMSRLNIFTFNIRSSSRFYNQINLPSNENIQNTFRADEKGHCHIYSYPYKLNYYDGITNNFPGGIFKYVRKVSLFDEHPFEHEFFLRIAQSFPLMEKLSVRNEQRQINKQFRQSKNENQDLSIIKYPYLKELDLIHSCIDYHAQFLLDMLM